MAGMGSVFRRLKHAGDDMGRQLGEKFPHFFKNFGDHYDTFIKKIKGIDHVDTPSPRPSSKPYRPDTSRKPASMSDEDYLRYLESSVHNPNGTEAVLGKFKVEGTPSYIDVAEGKHPPATYFSLGDEWGDIADAHNMTDSDMFDSFNVPFLDRIIAEGKPISFSHNPLDFPGSALADELDFLLGKGFVFNSSTMQAYLP